MLYYFDINKWIVTTVSGVSDTPTRRATLRLQLVQNKACENLLLYIFMHEIRKKNKLKERRK